MKYHINATTRAEYQTLYESRCPAKETLTPCVGNNNLACPITELHIILHTILPEFSLSAGCQLDSRTVKHLQPTTFSLFQVTSASLFRSWLFHFYVRWRIVVTEVFDSYQRNKLQCLLCMSAAAEMSHHCSCALPSCFTGDRRSFTEQEQESNSITILFHHTVTFSTLY